MLVISVRVIMFVQSFAQIGQPVKEAMKYIQTNDHMLTIIIVRGWKVSCTVLHSETHPSNNGWIAWAQCDTHMCHK